ncbi:MAG: nicotinamide riboside transporter PnuC [Halioglobus sp.]
MIADITPRLLLELLATSAGLVYVVLLIKEKIACWAFGIAGSLLSIVLFLDVRLYSEALLYLFYALMGVWGWVQWHIRIEEDRNPVIRWRLGLHLRTIVIACAIAVGLGYLMQHYSNAERPVFDAFTTVFSFLGTYLEITKVLEAWLYWLLINLASVWLYHDRALDIYAVLIGFYSVLSVWGFIQWRKTYLAQH